MNLVLEPELSSPGASLECHDLTIPLPGMALLIAEAMSQGGDPAWRRVPRSMLDPMGGEWSVHPLDAHRVRLVHERGAYRRFSLAAQRSRVELDRADALRTAERADRQMKEHARDPDTVAAAQATHDAARQRAERLRRDLAAYDRDLSEPDRVQWEIALDDPALEFVVRRAAR